MRWCGIKLQLSQRFVMFKACPNLSLQTPDILKSFKVFVVCLKKRSETSIAFQALVT